MAPNSANPDFEFSFRTRQSAWTALQSDPSRLHDVVIVGGGIVGAGIARQLAVSGVTGVVLIEKKDFASGTSSASSKLIHAGIRYLEQSWIHLKNFRLREAFRNFNFVVEASWERKILGEMAPGLVKPKVIYLVLARNDQRSILSVLLGVWVYYAIQIIQGQFFQKPRLIRSAVAIKSFFPEMDPNEVKAIFSFWDAETDDARLVIENIQDSHRRGVQILNYVELIAYQQSEREVQIQIKNQETGEPCSLRTRFLINATGAWVDQVRERGNAAQKNKLVDRVAGGHLDVYPVITRHSFYITSADGRLVFVLRREEDGLTYSRIGTTERPLRNSDGSDGIKPLPEELRYLKNIVLQYFPRAPLDTANVIHLDEGIRPLRAQEGTDAFNKSREHEFIDEGRVVHVVGVKLTDFRRAAGELVHFINWSRYGISIKSQKMACDPLRSPGERRLYLERTLEETCLRTMVLHWDDYVERRKGRWPAYQKKFHPDQLEKDILQMGRVLEWDPSRIAIERSRVELS